jgi:hypothetical protein
VRKQPDALKNVTYAAPQDVPDKISRGPAFDQHLAAVGALQPVDHFQ